MRVIAVINQKGGVGKTTTAINLASELSRLKKKVLLIDLDPQGNATSGLGITLHENAKAVDDVLLSQSEVSDCLISIDDSGFDLIASDSKLAGIELQISDQPEKEFILKNAVSKLDYDIVIIDCPPSLGVLSINSLAAATEVLIPVQAEYYALEGLSQLVGLIDRVRESANPELKILGLVLTMYDKRTTLATDVRAQLEEHFKKAVFETNIPRNIRLAEAPSHGLPINRYDKWSKGSRAYKSLAKEVVSRG